MREFEFEELQARDSQRATRRGLHLQSYVDRYSPLVQQQMRRMKFKNADKGQSVKPSSCASALIK